jgi:filamentous hemagglutinin family protein
MKAIYRHRRLGRKFVLAWITIQLVFPPGQLLAGAVGRMGTGSMGGNTPISSMPSPSVGSFNTTLPGFYGAKTNLPAVAADALPQLKPDGTLEGASIDPAEANKLTVNQQEEKAIIDWQSFNIGREAWVHFKQTDDQGTPRTDWLALNRIYDTHPSQIFGKMSADGKVFLVNQNGILFGPGSRVNLHTLVASSLNIDNDDFLNGRWKFKADNYIDPDEAPPLDTAVSNHGEIVTSDTGSAFLVAPTVENNGLIITPLGQTGLVAGTEVELEDPGVTGTRSERFVRITRDPGRAVNFENGRIEADTGLAGMYGRVVNQDGLIKSVTAVRKNGQIELFATERITTGSDSLTATPVSDSDDTVHPSFDNLKGSIRIKGLGIDEGADIIEHRGTIAAPSGFVEMDANKRVFLDSNSRIDVGGLWVDRPAEYNQIEVQLNSVELSDDFYVREGNLKGEKVQISALEGAAIGNIAGYLNAREKTARERNVTGGSVEITARDGDIIMKEGASIDFSGGGFHYRAGQIETTKVKIAGKIYDIGEVPDTALENGENLEIVDAVELKNKYRISSKTSIPAYDEGADAGELALAAKQMVIDGGLDGSVTRGVYQTETAELADDSGRQKTAGRKEPTGGTLIVGYQEGQNRNPMDFLLEDVVIKNKVSPLPAGFGADPQIFPYPEDRNGQTLLSADTINSAGLSNIEIYTNTLFRTNPNTRIALRSGARQDNWRDASDEFSGRITVFARRIEHYGEIAVNSGTISLYTADNITSLPSYLGQANPRYIDLHERIFLADGSILDASGEEISNYTTDVRNMRPPQIGHIDGGRVEILDQTFYGDGVIVQNGSSIDVSGGFIIDASGNVTGGDGGTLELQGPSLILDGEMNGHAAFGRTGGSVILHADNVSVAATAPGLDPNFEADTLLPDAFKDRLILAQHRLDNTGFTHIDLRSVYDLTVAPGIELNPSRIQIQTPIPGWSNKRRIGVDDRFIPSSSIRLSAGMDRKGVDVGSNGLTDRLTIAEGSRITAASGGEIDITAPDVWINGTLSALGGAIAVNASRRDLVLESGSQILAYGYNQPEAEPLLRGLPVNHQPHDGGTVTMEASQGELVVAPGVVIDVSGSRPIQNAYMASNGRIAYRTLAADAGTLSLSARDLNIDGEYRARTHLTGLVGGTLDITSFNTEDAYAVHAGDIQTYTSAGFDALAFRSLVGIQFEDAVSPATGTIGRSLILDAPLLSGPATGDVSFRAAWIQLQNRYEKYRNASVVNASDYFAADKEIAVGNSRLALNGKWLDLTGNIGLDRFSEIQLYSDHDIRLSDEPYQYNKNTGLYSKWSGRLLTQSDLVLTADRIYPTTRSAFTLSSGVLQKDGSREGGKITTLAGKGNTGAFIYSAGGSVRLDAETIAHYGYLAAPMGTLTLAGAGSRSRVYLADGSVLTTKAEIPVNYGRMDDVYWSVADKADNPAIQGLPVEAAPESAIRIDGTEIIAMDGSEVDVSSAGGIFTYDFLASIQGTTNPLSKGDRYVILAQNSDLLPGKGVYLKGSNLVPDGTYSLLPEYYAFLPGAVVIEDLGMSNVTGARNATVAGNEVVTGFETYLGTGIRSKQPHEYSVRPAGDIMSEGFFWGYYLPAGNGGELSVLGNTTIMDGSIQGKGSAGYTGGRLKLSGREVLIGATTTPLIDFDFDDAIPEDARNKLQLDVAAISNSGFRALEIGSDEGNAAFVPRRVTILGGTQLNIPILSLSASNSVENQIEIELADNVRITADTVRLEARNGGISAAQSAAVEADLVSFYAKAFDYQGSLEVKDTLLLGSPNTIGVGGASGFSLSDDFRQNFADIPNIAVTSRSGLAFSGDARLTAGERLVLDTPRIVGDKDAAQRQITIDAPALYLLNSGNANFDPALADDDRIVFDAAGSIYVGHGDLVLDGFKSVSFEAGRDLVFSGRGSLAVDGENLDLAADRITADFYSDETTTVEPTRFLVEAPGSRVTITGGDGTLSEATSTLPGQSLEIIARGIDHFGAIDLFAGRVALAAVGTGGTDGILLGDGARILVNGGVVTRTIAGDPVLDFRKGGQVDLSAAAGPIQVRTGALVNVSNMTGTGIDSFDAEGMNDLIRSGMLDAGSVALSAPVGGVVLDGDLSGASLWGSGGDFSIDTLRLDAENGNNRFSHMVEKITAGGFDREVTLRARTGSIAVGNADPLENLVLKADRIKIIADSGAIDVFDTIDASGTSDNRRVELFARRDINLRAGSRITAEGIGNGAAGGDVTIGSSDYLDDVTDEPTGGRILMEEGAVIDVSAGDGERGGSVFFRALRSGSDARMDLFGTLYGASRVSAEAVDIRQNITVIDRTLQNELMGQTREFMDNAVLNRTEDRLVASLVMKEKNITGEWVDLDTDLKRERFHLLPGIEIRSRGDIRLTAEWDLSSVSGYLPTYPPWTDPDYQWRYGSEQEPGMLTLRAAGKLDIAKSLYDQPTAGVKPDYRPVGWDSWGLTLVSGADLGSADVLQVVVGSGDLVIQNNTLVYTESAPLRFASGGDTNLGTARSLDTNRFKDMISRSLATSEGDITGFVGGNLTLAGGTNPATIQSAVGNIDLLVGGDLRYNVDLTGKISGSGSAVRTTGVPAELTVADLPDDHWLFSPIPWLPGTPRYIDVLSEEEIDYNLYIESRTAFDRYSAGGSIQVAAGGSIRGRMGTQGWFHLYNTDPKNLQTGASYVKTNGTIPTEGLATMAGGDLIVSVGGDFLGQIGAFGDGDVHLTGGGNIDGRFLVTDGRGHISALGSIGDAAYNYPNQVLELLDGDVEMRAFGNIRLGSIIDPGLVIPEIASVWPVQYSEDAGVRLITYHGDVWLTGDSDFHSLGSTTPRYIHERILPPSLEMVAGGDIDLSHTLVMTPPAEGHLVLKAGGNISGPDATAPANILISDLAPEVVYPRYQRPRYAIRSGDGRILNVVEYRTDQALMTDNNLHGFATGGGEGKSYIAIFKTMWETEIAAELPAGHQPLLSEAEKAYFQSIYDEVMGGSYLLHQGDETPIELKAGGDIANIGIVAPKKSDIFAGHDITNFYYLGQNLADRDMTRIQAARNISYEFGGGSSTNTGIHLGGPGWLMVQAGSFMGLGTSNGIDTFGNIFNTNLVETGSAMVATAGYAKTWPPDELGNFFEQLRDAGTEFTALQQGTIIRDGTTEDITIGWARALADELPAALAAKYLDSLSGYEDYAEVPESVRDQLAKLRAEAAQTEIIDRFFKGADSDFPDYSVKVPNGGPIGVSLLGSAAYGNIDMVRSQIVTQNSGDIYMLAAGKIDVGISAFADESQKENTGINAKFNGDINIYLEDDLNVNESRVMTWYGGDITTWSNQGDINAGKGSKTAVNTSRPTKVWTGDRWVIQRRPAAVGSGIRLLTFDPDGVEGPLAPPPFGDGYLFAPAGVIDAGEAGIFGGGNLIFGADEVVNVQNIDTLGLSIGAPPPADSSSNLGALTGAGSLTESSKMAQESAALTSAKDRFNDYVAQLSESLKLRYLKLEFMGFDDEDDDVENQEGKSEDAKAIEPISAIYEKIAN